MSLHCFEGTPVSRSGMYSLLGSDNTILATSGINTKSQYRFYHSHHDMEVNTETFMNYMWFAFVLVLRNLMALAKNE